MENTMIKEQVKKMMDEAMPYVELDYRNSIVAKAIANGHKEKLTENWLMRALIGDIEDGFITYGQAIAIKDEYYKAMQAVAAQF